jgi:hypothetical protein
MKFMLMGLEAKGEWERLPEAERAQRVQLHQQALQGLIAERGLVDGQSLVLTSVGLGPASEATTVRTNGGKPVLTDGPFAETKEVLAGFDLIEFASRDEAVAFARRRCVHDGQVTEIRPVRDSWWAYHGPGSGDAKRFMIMLVADVETLAKWSQAQIDRNVAHHQQVGMEYSSQKGIVRGEPLCFSSARLRPRAEAITLRVRNGQSLTSDGPFAETKEVLGGFFIIDCASQDEAIKWALKMSAISGETAEIRPVQSMWSIYHG